MEPNWTHDDVMFAFTKKCSGHQADHLFLEDVMISADWEPVWLSRTNHFCLSTTEQNIPKANQCISTTQPLCFTGHDAEKQHISENIQDGGSNVVAAVRG